MSRPEPCPVCQGVGFTVWHFGGTRGQHKQPCTNCEAGEGAKPSPFTEAESVFLERMAPHFAAGLSVEESARAVLADDERLFCALHDRDTGPAIRETLARDVYNGIRGKA